MSFSIKQIQDFAKKIQSLKETENFLSLLPERPLPENEDDVSVGLVVDVEATGLCAVRDEVIELGTIKFYYDNKKNEFLQLIKTYNGLQKPKDRHKEKFAPSQNDLANGEDGQYLISQLTGITWDELENSEGIDWVIFEEDLIEADMVVAYNSDYDEKMCSKYVKVETPWNCAMKKIDWRGRGFNNFKQEVLVAQDLGFKFGAHRALNDCEVLLLLLVQEERFSELLSPLVELQVRGFVNKEFTRLYLSANRFYFQSRKSKNEDGTYSDDKYWSRKMQEYEVEMVKADITDAANFVNKKNNLSFEVKNVKNGNKFMR